MRKMLFAAFASTMLLALALPAGALAHHRSARHTLRRHHKHAAMRILDFHAASAPSAPSAQPAPTPPTPPTPEKVGTVASFTGGVLTIKLNDNSTVSGKVTEQTEIHCTSANPPNGGDDQGSGDDNHGEASSTPQGDASPTLAHESWARAGEEQSGERSNDNGTDGEEDNGQSNCPANPLVEGTPVLDAELAVGPGGAVWKHVDLLQ